MSTHQWRKKYEISWTVIITDNMLGFRFKGNISIIDIHTLLKYMGLWVPNILDKTRHQATLIKKHLCAFTGTIH